MVIVCSFLIACNEKKVDVLTNLNNLSEIQSINNKNDSIVSKWRLDSLGCEHLRTIEMGKQIFDKYSNNGQLKDTIDIKLIFGNPNKKMLLDNQVNFFFYINSCCNRNKLNIKECDYSFINIIYSNEEKKIIFNSGIL